MKLIKTISIILALVFALSSLQICAFATNETDEVVIEHVNDDMSIAFHNPVTAETKEKIIAHFTDENCTLVESRGITCTLLGHKLETGTTSTITHKVKSTAPRCLMETFRYEICSRCDYSNYTLIASEYVFCCS